MLSVELVRGRRLYLLFIRCMPSIKGKWNGEVYITQQELHASQRERFIWRGHPLITSLGESSLIFASNNADGG